MDWEKDRTTIDKIWEKIKYKRTASASACPKETSLYSTSCSAWLFTFMCMNIPIAGWIYLLHLAFGREENQLRDFAKAYPVYKLVFLAIALVLLGIMIWIGLDFADKVLTYMGMP